MTGGDAASEGLEEVVETAQAELAEAVEVGGLRRDPLRFVLAALSSALGVFPAAVRRVEAASEAVRQPLSPKAEAELLRRVEEAARRGAAGAGPAIARRTAVLASALLAAAALLGTAGGWWAGRASVPVEVEVAERGIRMSLAASEAWLPILLANPDPRPALARGQVFRDERTGWRAGTITLYLEPGQPTPAAPRR
ncbi:MAG: hypothetical protein K2X74_20005 [Acetobacteraceae bacterium]|nr:hypothetical protein [Acetobacteraceae bacterium]